jgi:hypothetical protein
MITKTKATKQDSERLKTWGTVLAALEALQKAYLETNAEADTLMQEGNPAGTARNMRDSLGEMLRPLEVELWQNAKSSGLSMPTFLTI